MKIGLTGGIGCGKSTALAIFRELGWKTVDADLLVKDLLDNDHEVFEAIRGHFGAGVVGLNGRIDRAAVADIVFADSNELDWLEGLLHPRVREAWTALLEADPAADWVVEIPLLFEKNLENTFDLSVCISASESAQRHRLAAKGVTPEQYQARLMRQMPITEKMRRAHRVICNDGSKTFLRDQIVHLCDTQCGAGPVNG